MNSIYYVVVPLLALLGTSFTQKSTPSPVTCHDPNAVAQEPMAAFLNDPSFAAAHPVPGNAGYAGAGETVTLSPSDGKPSKAILFKASKPGAKWLFVIHEWWGLNDWIKLESERYYKELGDVNVLVLDMYDGRIATSPDSAGKFMQQMKQDRGSAIVNAAIAFAGKDARISTVGWCFGGGWSLQASLLASKQAVACVMYYGMPVPDVEKLKTLNSPVLFVLANQDKWITPKVANDFAANMKSAGKSLEIKAYDADHAFANPSNPKHNAELASQAFASSIGFIRANLK
jgi:carboxymethylenebutenolidase